MLITKEKTDNTIVLRVEGKIDTLTSPELEQAIADTYEDCGKLVIDLSKVDYISSAGLRVIVVANREMEKHDGLIIRNLSKNVKNVLTITGFNKTLNIEE